MRVSAYLTRLIENELETDNVSHDITANLLDADRNPCTAAITAKQEGVFSGEAVVNAFRAIFRDELQIHCVVSEGQVVKPGDTVVRLHATISLCLSIERTLLNLLCHLCGVATLTRKYVDAVGDNPTKILATRKTLPGLREVQLDAVVAGGGFIHRRSLSDGFLIKENHQAFVESSELIRRARAKTSPLHGIEIEIQELTILEQLASDWPDVIMLDNLEIDQIRDALKTINKRSRVEVSGGIEVYEVKPLADLGVDYISVGKLTHSAPALDLSLDIIAEKLPGSKSHA